MKKFAPLLLVLLAASLWSWTQLPRPPKIVPTRANCAVHGVHLGDKQSEVILQIGKPDRVEGYYPKGSEPKTLWSWGSATAPQLSVSLDSDGVCAVVGTSLTIESKDYGIDAGAPLSGVDFLGSPLRGGPMETSLLKTSWEFPELKVALLSDEREQVRYVQIEKRLRPRSPTPDKPIEGSE